MIPAAFLTLCRFSLFIVAILARLVAVLAAELSTGCRWVLEETRRAPRPAISENLPTIDLRGKN